MMPANIDADKNNVSNNYCGDPTIVPSINSCTNDLLNTSQLRDDYIKNCFGKKQCTIDLSASIYRKKIGATTLM